MIFPLMGVTAEPLLTPTEVICRKKLALSRVPVGKVETSDVGVEGK